jgi:PTH1 family peptidyl-tRNA hydrolase
MWSLFRLLGFGKRTEQQATDNMIKYLVVGLGNIGPEYHKTRHNTGFMVVDKFAEKNNAPAWEDRRYGFVNRVNIKGRQIVLLKPSTFMNLSGNAVRYWMKEENIALENLLVVVDDLSLPLGELRLKPKGSDAGHNGLKHIADILGTQAYARLRFGIGNEYPRGGQVNYVLSEFDDEDLKILPERINQACEMIKSFCLAGINITMNQYNKK